VPHGKNIVICCDGTGQTIRAAQKGSVVARTNVLRLFDLVEKDTPQHQIACYDPGLGTVPGLEGDIGFVHKLKNIRDEWLGSGLMANLATMYVYLMNHYEASDRIFLFGFSRGAFAVRALAGMIRCIGLLREGHESLLPWARDVYENMEARHVRARRRDEESGDELAREFRRFTRTDKVQIAFLGIWDTVKAYGYMRPKGVPFVRNNLQVDVVRHAIAIDEKRSPFQVTGWSDRAARSENPLANAAIREAIHEVWFSGDHSDVGGGHEDSRTEALSRVCFDWMLGEAVHYGLKISPRYNDATRWAAASPSLETCTPHDLTRVGAGKFMWMPPRIELNNAHFPSQRTFHMLTHTGKRCLLDHSFPDVVWRKSEAAKGASPILPVLQIHESVCRRYRDGGYAPDNLCEVLEAKRRGEVAIEWVQTRATAGAGVGA
jgi:uncharacterized protein (DUF2235 family)